MCEQSFSFRKSFAIFSFSEIFRPDLQFNGASKLKTIELYAWHKTKSMRWTNGVKDNNWKYFKYYIKLMMKEIIPTKSMRNGEFVFYFKNRDRSTGENLKDARPS